jgi:hypothetical protein
MLGHADTVDRLRWKEENTGTLEVPYTKNRRSKLASLAGLAVHREKSRSCSGESTMGLSVMKVAYL